MKRAALSRSAALALVVTLGAHPLGAQTLADPPPEAEDSARRGFDLMQEGARLLLRGLVDEMTPQVERMTALARILGDFENFEAPEVLPNGDVLIRRKQATPPPEDRGADPPPDPSQGGDDEADL